MNRQPTPSILDAVLTADEPAVDRLALRHRLRWDYSQVSPTDRKQVEDAAVDILANGQRLQQSAVAIGERLIGVKRFLAHGLFGDWCATEFHMSQKTAENMMNVAREFGDKIETVSILTDSAMYMLAAPSTPEPARQQAIEEAQATGKSPTKSRVREIIAEHKPQPTTPRQFAAAVKAATWGDRTVDVLPPATAPLPQWADEPAPPHYTARQPDDDRLQPAQRLRALYQAVIDSDDQYGELTGRFSDTLAVKRELESMIGHLDFLINAITHPEEVSE